ncbi:hypothetical protein PLIP_b0131 [Pseudoalteromonas lipolytica LMEB 39]|nr:hypothetical protein [Pseudoalteromonas lipolytica LMEB 39]
MSDLFQATKIIAALFKAATAFIIASTGAFSFFYRLIKRLIA